MANDSAMRLVEVSETEKQCLKHPLPLQLNRCSS
jgi:hypothetical protein